MRWKTNAIKLREGLVKQNVLNYFDDILSETETILTIIRIVYSMYLKLKMYIQ